MLPIKDLRSCSVLYGNWIGFNQGVWPGRPKNPRLADHISEATTSGGGRLQAMRDANFCFLLRLRLQRSRAPGPRKLAG